MTACEFRISDCSSDVCSSDLTLSMMITTIPIVAPVMFGLGFDPVWFGIVIIIMIEMALITPPVGLNLFVVQSLRTSGTLNDVIAGSEIGRASWRERVCQYVSITVAG